MDPALQELVDARAIEQVFVRYFDRVDAGDPEGAAALFSEDARIEIMTGKEYRGREAYRRALGRVLAQYDRTSHHVSNIAVQIDGDRAEAVAYVYAFHRLVEDPDRLWHLWARIVDVLERTDEGWVITDHVLHGVDSDPDWEKVSRDWYRGHPGRAAREVQAG